jgi:hypothetical protein
MIHLRKSLKLFAQNVINYKPRFKADPPLACVWDKVVDLLPEVLPSKLKTVFISPGGYRNLLAGFIQEFNIEFQGNPSQKTIFIYI